MLFQVPCPTSDGHTALDLYNKRLEGTTSAMQESARSHGCRFHRAWHTKRGSMFVALAEWETAEGANAFFEERTNPARWHFVSRGTWDWCHCRNEDGQNERRLRHKQDSFSTDHTVIGETVITRTSSGAVRPRSSMVRLSGSPRSRSAAR